MTARYLIRFDDICPTMDWDAWEQIERILILRDVKPILAVVPDNQDPKLDVGSRNEEFWARVRAWQARGWTIGWHGYQHTYDSDDSGLVGINPFSEFAGHEVELQRARLSAAYGIFTAHHVRPDLWVAPAHSFDRSTVEVLGSFGIRLISDGFYSRAISQFGAIWIPQQLWSFRWMPYGLWTVCYHINGWGRSDIEGFERELATYARRLTSVPEVRALSYPEKRLLDCAFESVFRRLVMLKKVLNGKSIVNVIE